MTSIARTSKSDVDVSNILPAILNEVEPEDEKWLKAKINGIDEEFAALNRQLHALKTENEFLLEDNAETQQNVADYTQFVYLRKEEKRGALIAVQTESDQQLKNYIEKEQAKNLHSQQIAESLQNEIDLLDEESDEKLLELAKLKNIVERRREYDEIVCTIEEEALEVSNIHTDKMTILKSQIAAERAAILAANERQVQTLDKHSAKEATTHLTKQLQKHLVILKDLKASIEAENTHLYAKYDQVRKLQEVYKRLNFEWEVSQKIEENLSQSHPQTHAESGIPARDT